MCKNPRMEIDRPAVAELMADVAAAVARRADAVSGDVYEAILQQIPQLRDDKPVLTLLASSVDSNVDTCLQIMQHRIDLAAVRAPAAATEYARRLAQRGTPLTALLRAYRLGHTCFSDWLIRELARQARDAEMLSAATLGMSRVVAGYIDQTSEEMVDAYAQARENWLRKRSAARAARIADLLAGGRIDVGATEATLGYRLRQYHVGLVCWVGDTVSAADEISRLEQAVGCVAGKAVCLGDPVFLPRDETSAWAWLPMGIRDTFDPAAAAGVDADVRFAFGDAARGAAGFRLTHQQALEAQAVALTAGSHVPQAVAFGEVAPIAMMLGSTELLRAWVLSTLADLADDDEHHARLRETLLVFLQTGGSYKTTAERLMLHKNTVQYRIRKARESLGRPMGENRYEVELALQASRWLGSSVRRPAAGHDHDPQERAH
jgi:DNA-binding PucR family transcriptional regulator